MKVLTAAVSICVLAPALAADGIVSPYSGQESREVKAFSDEEVPRNVHLTAHLKQIRVLRPAQVQRYIELRGYSSSHAHHTGHDQRG